MKTIRLQPLFLMLGLGLLFASFTSCKKDPKPVECTRQGTLTTPEIASCTPLLIRDDNGSLLEPVNQSMLTGYKAKQRVTFSFKPVYLAMANCSGGAPVELTCIRPSNSIPPPSCTPLKKTTDPSTPPDATGVSISNAYIQNGCLKIECGFSGCSDDISRFELAWDGMMRNNKVHLTLKDRLSGTICQAYFTKTLSFDVSPLKTGTSEVHITVGGWNKEIVY